MSHFINSTVHSLIPNPGNHTLTAEISCYSLPYGGIGFAGHVATYWTVASLIIGRQPWRIWEVKPLKNRLPNLILDGLSLILSVGSASFALYRCRGEWQFALLAVWKITMAISLSGMALHRTIDLHTDRAKYMSKLQKRSQSSLSLASLTRNSSNPAYEHVYNQPDHSYGEDESFMRPAASTYDNYSNTPAITKDELEEPIPKLTLFVWLLLYSVGTIAGLIGLFSIVHERWASNVVLQKVTSVFLGLAFGPAALYICLVVLGGTLGKKLRAGHQVFLIFTHMTLCLLIFGAWVGIIAAFYSDWALGAIMHNLAGVPSLSNWMIYTVYFIAKRLPLAST
jgi:hypothetical protein